MAAARGLVIVFLLFLSEGFAHFGYNPKPNPSAVVNAGNARFTVLTDHIIRMEYGKEIDAATFGVVNRYLPVPNFKVQKDSEGWTVIITDALTLRYDSSSKTTFGRTNLQVMLSVEGEVITWTPVPATLQSISGNLLGTFRTLDGNTGTNEPLNCYENSRADLHCTLGLISRHGYAVVDETYRPQFDTDPDWPWVTTVNVTPPSTQECAIDPYERLACGGNPIQVSTLDCVGRGCCYDDTPMSGAPYCYYSVNGYQDLYFFGHGHDYKKALYEFTLISGKVPLPPRFAFGIFYSRYWAYTDMEEMDLVEDYEEHTIPLDVLVTDMDWHITFYKEASEGKKDQAGQSIGWTGFTWDSHLFTQPKMFLDWCKARGLKNTLNIHPASGIQPWEEKYTEMAEAMGIDPKTKKYVPCVLQDKKFVTNWLKIVMGERETQGIDFWWLDWQQGEDWIKLPGVNPTFWLNYVFFTNPYHWNGTAPKFSRPMILHRFGGLGNHRYQTGFSGDVLPSWSSLEFQVKFTISASNVAFGYWSHDLGGHISLPAPDLYTRWIQWGTFSPLFRTHCTKNWDDYRRPWLFPPNVYPILRRFFRLREMLVPYIYTQARTAYDTGLSILRGMYYEYPEMEEAYTFNATQYFFGDNFVVSPITTPNDTATALTEQTVWIPEGYYMSMFSGELFKGPVVLKRNYTLEEMPVFVQVGSIIPMLTSDFEPIGTAKSLPQTVRLWAFVGGMTQIVGAGNLYEDDGHTINYTKNEYTRQLFNYTVTSNTMTFNIFATSNLNILPFKTRSYEVVLYGYWPAAKVSIDGTTVSYTPYGMSSYGANTWTYDGKSLSVIITTDFLDLTKDHMITIATDNSPFSVLLQSDYTGLSRRFLLAKQMLDQQWGKDTVWQEDYFALMNATQVASRITFVPQDTEMYLKLFPTYHENAIKEVMALANLNKDVKLKVLSLITDAQTYV